MMRRHDVLLVIDCSTGVVRSAPINVPATVCAVILATAFPILMGLGAKLSARAELEHLRTMHAMLEEENASYRSATTAFSEQIQSLASVISEVQTNGETSRGPASAHRVAILERARAIGGTATGGPALVSTVVPSLSSPEQILEVTRATCFKSSRVDSRRSNEASNGERRLRRPRRRSGPHRGGSPGGLAFAATRCPENRVFIRASTSRQTRGNRCMRPVTALWKPRRSLATTAISWSSSTASA